MASRKDFSASSRHDLVRQVNDWLSDQFVNGDVYFRVVGDEHHGVSSQSYTILFEGEEFVEPAESARDTQYSEFPTTTRQSTVEGGPTIREVLIFLAVMTVIVVGIVWAISH